MCVRRRTRTGSRSRRERRRRMRRRRRPNRQPNRRPPTPRPLPSTRHRRMTVVMRMSMLLLRVRGNGLMAPGRCQRRTIQHELNRHRRPSSLSMRVGCGFVETWVSGMRFLARSSSVTDESTVMFAPVAFTLFTLLPLPFSLLLLLLPLVLQRLPRRWPRGWWRWETGYLRGGVRVT